MTGAKETAAQKPTEVKAESQAETNLPSDIDNPLEQTDKPADMSKEIDIGKPDTKILTEKLEAPQTDDKTGDVTEATLESAAEIERLADEAEGLSAEDGQTDSIVQAEDLDAESLSQEAVDTQTDKLTDDVSGSLVEDSVDAENSTEKKEDFQADKQADDQTGVDIESSDTEILTEGLETQQVDDPTGEVTDAILEAAAETERLAEEAEKLEDEAEGLQIENEQTVTMVEAEDSDTAESLSKGTEETQKDELTDDVSESIVEGSVDAENQTEEKDDTKTDVPSGEVIEAEAAAEKLAEEVEGLPEGEQPGILVEAEDSADVENPTEEKNDTKTDTHAGEVTESAAEEMVTGDFAESKSVVDRIKKLLSGESKTVVDRIKKLLSGKFSIGNKSDDSTEEEVEGHAETEILTEGTGDIHTDVQEEKVVETVAEDPESVEYLTESADDTLADKQVGDADEGVDEGPDSVANHTRKADDTQIDSQEVSTTETSVDDEIQAAVYSESKPGRTKKTGIIISVFIVIAAVILLLVASVERRSAKEALVQVSKVAESIKRVQGETLKSREQVTHSQIESSELVIDALLLTRNGLELERANSDEVEVKRIIGVFISDIDERITKIKDNIVLLRNKLEEAD